MHTPTYTQTADILSQTALHGGGGGEGPCLHHASWSSGRGKDSGRMSQRPPSLGFSRERLCAVGQGVVLFVFPCASAALILGTKARGRQCWKRTAFERKWLSWSCFRPAGGATGQSPRLTFALAPLVWTAWAVGQGQDRASSCPDRSWVSSGKELLGRATPADM